jgi:hypothetical protein
MLRAFCVYGSSSPDFIRAASKCIYFWIHIYNGHGARHPCAQYIS